MLAKCCTVISSSLGFLVGILLGTAFFVSQGMFCDCPGTGTLAGVFVDKYTNDTEGPAYWLAANVGLAQFLLLIALGVLAGAVLLAVAGRRYFHQSWLIQLFCVGVFIPGVIVSAWLATLSYGLYQLAPIAVGGYILLTLLIAPVIAARARFARDTRR